MNQSDGEWIFPTTKLIIVIDKSILMSVTFWTFVC